ncbi:MAG: tRNA (adenosine(37)-N6)-dimethylallyltransferase MiaA, partial [Butyricicoccus sp.]|nr:tRNA (adenosine(37)-N6)-dimethylallyltransferase MiaA [Butyricicoccus sp.]
DPGEDFSVARYVECADQCAQHILQQGKIPIVVGGTGLYLDALIAGNDFSGDEADTALRNELEQFAEQYGNQALHERLQAIDPVRAQQLHPNNRKRVIRAIEVYQQTGMTLDEFNQKNQRPAPKYRAVKIGVCPQEREVLYERINARVDQMLEQGLLDEVRKLLASGHFTGTAAQAIGYKEYIPFLEGSASLEECTQLLKQHSRNYAKRQMTWLKRDSKIHWIYYETGIGLDEVVRRSTEILASEGL